MLFRLRLTCFCLSTTLSNSFHLNLRRNQLVGAVSFLQQTPPSYQCRRMAHVDGSGTNDGQGRGDIGQQGEITVPTSEEKSWRSLLEVSSARSRKIRGSNYVQLATVDPVTGEPRCRTVVFRGFQKLPAGHKYFSDLDEMSCVMKMITDFRSRKVGEVAAHPTNAAEMVWWFPKTSEQYRVQGRLLFVGSGQFVDDEDKDLVTARKVMWGNLSDAARESFFATPVPGAAYSSESETIPEGGRDKDGKLLTPPDNFLLMLLLPKSADYLRLTDNYHQRGQLLDSEWSASRLNP